MLDKLQGYAADRCLEIQERQKKGQMEGGRKEGRGEELGKSPRRSIRARNEERNSRLTFKHNSATVTAANRIRLCQSEAVKLYFTQSTLTHYPIEQLYNALGYKLFSCEGNWLFQCA